MQDSVKVKVIAVKSEKVLNIRTLKSVISNIIKIPCNIIFHKDDIFPEKNEASVIITGSRTFKIIIAGRIKSLSRKIKKIEADFSASAEYKEQIAA